MDNLKSKLIRCIIGLVKSENSPNGENSKNWHAAMIFLGGLIIWSGICMFGAAVMAENSIQIPGGNCILPTVVVVGGIGLVILANHNLSKK